LYIVISDAVSCEAAQECLIQVVLIPTYNEAGSIIELLQELQNIDIDVIVIDDDSPDKTAQIVKQTEFPNVRVIDNGRKKGIGSAYLAGITFALQYDYEFIATMDCRWISFSKKFARNAHFLSIQRRSYGY